MVVVDRYLVGIIIIIAIATIIIIIMTVCVLQFLAGAGAIRAAA
jgi:hypothetical protein